MTPDWSHNGASVVYTSTDSAHDGRVGAANDTDIYRVPFYEGKGGQAMPVEGAAQSGIAEYYPDYSADDALIAFNRLAEPESLGWVDLYQRPESEIWVVGAAPADSEVEVGGAIRLRANDSNTCSEEKSPGLVNSWGRWSPTVEEIDGTRYYWLVFTSARDATGRFDASTPTGDPRHVKLYLTAVTITAGVARTTPAIRVRGQREGTSNLIPHWGTSAR